LRYEEVQEVAQETVLAVAKKIRKSWFDSRMVLADFIEWVMSSNTCREPMARVQ